MEDRQCIGNSQAATTIRGCYTHRQEHNFRHNAATDTWADGSATVQMILDRIGVAPLPTEATIYAEIQANNSEPAFWYRAVSRAHRSRRHESRRVEGQDHLPGK